MAGVERRARVLTVLGALVLVVAAPFFITATFYVPAGAALLVTPVACLVVAAVLRRVPRRGRAWSWAWLGACLAYGLALVVLLYLFSRGGVPGD